MVNDFRFIFLRRYVHHADSSNSGDGRYGDDCRRCRRRCRRSFHHHCRFRRAISVQSYSRADLRALDQHRRTIDHILEAVVPWRVEDGIDTREVA